MKQYLVLYSWHDVSLMLNEVMWKSGKQESRYIQILHSLDEMKTVKPLPLQFSVIMLNFYTIVI
jgi:hypothetical protein